MRLLIDGYNLLHSTDLFGVGELEGTLRGSREALLGFLARRLNAKERAAAVIVFDARDAPAGLPDRLDFQGIDIRFARGYPDADAMIEEILHHAKGTRQLKVVSGDRRVQRAARSRGAKPVESRDWFLELCRRRDDEEATPAAKEPIGDAAHWVREFSDPRALEEIARQAESAPPPKPAHPAPAPPPPSDNEQRKKKKSSPRRRSELGGGDKPTEKEFGAGVFDPFPPNYAQDLERRFLSDSDSANDQPGGAP